MNSYLAIQHASTPTTLFDRDIHLTDIQAVINTVMVMEVGLIRETTRTNVLISLPAIGVNPAIDSTFGSSLIYHDIIIQSMHLKQFNEIINEFFYDNNRLQHQ